MTQPMTQPMNQPMNQQMARTLVEPTTPPTYPQPSRPPQLSRRQGAFRLDELNDHQQLGVIRRLFDDINYHGSS